MPTTRGRTSSVPTFMEAGAFFIIACQHCGKVLYSRRTPYRLSLG
nr:MAG TPA: Rubredoxin-like zinc ribbon domain protein [Caudoviricetes sp.]